MEPAFTLRSATTGDIPSIMEIEQLCFNQDSFSGKQFAYLITRAKGYFDVAEYQGRIVGYLSTLINKRACSLRIYSVAVHPDFRGKGGGQRLISRAADITHKEGLKKITLEVNVSNLSAIRLYRKNGFECTGIRANYYHDGANAYCMQKLPAGE